LISLALFSEPADTGTQALSGVKRRQHRDPIVAPSDPAGRAVEYDVLALPPVKERSQVK